MVVKKKYLGGSRDRDSGNGRLTVDASSSRIRRTAIARQSSTIRSACANARIRKFRGIPGRVRRGEARYRAVRRTSYPHGA